MAHGSPDYSITTLTAGGAVTIQPVKPYYNRDIVNRIAGDVVVFDPATSQGAKACTVASDPRVLGVVSDVSVAPGNFENLYYHGQAMVKVIGTGSAGAALVTSATSGAAQANGTIADQPGFVGVALQSWAGPGLILADLAVECDLFNGNVAVENIIAALGNTGTASLNCGVNGFRTVLAFSIMQSDTGNNPAISVVPKVNGVGMTSLQNGGGSFYGWALHYLDNPNTGLQTVTAPTWINLGTNMAIMTVFVALSGFNARRTPHFTDYTVAVSAFNIASTDAVAGDQMIGCLMLRRAGAIGAVINARGGNQTILLEQEQFVVNQAVRLSTESKIATTPTDGLSWGTSVAEVAIVQIIPLKPA
jgi:hypothetical protein